LVIEDLWAWFTDPAVMYTYGYFGILGVSFLGSLIVFVPVPYFLFVVLASVNSNFDPTFVGIISAIGATAGKVIIFKASYTGSRFIGKNAEERIRPFKRLVGRYGWMAAFLAAVTPLPDDLGYIPLGFAKYSITRFWIATLSGKLIFTLFIAWGSRLSFQYIEYFVEGVRDPLGAILVAATFLGTAIITIYAIMRLDWAKVLKRWFPWTVEG